MSLIRRNEKVSAVSLVDTSSSPFLESVNDEAVVADRQFQQLMELAFGVAIQSLVSQKAQAATMLARLPLLGRWNRNYRSSLSNYKTITGTSWNSTSWR
jgi:hypothetical protein